MIAVVDMGLGNLFNVFRAITHVGGDAMITDEQTIVSQAEKIVLPGVGSYKAGMQALRNKQLVRCIVARASEGIPLLGICLGMQLLLDESEENGVNDGLGIIPGRVINFRNMEGFDNNCKVPYVGWSGLFSNSTTTSWRKSVLRGCEEGDDCYFVHSYCVVPECSSDLLASTRYGGIDLLLQLSSITMLSGANFILKQVEVLV